MGDHFGVIDTIEQNLVRVIARSIGGERGAARPQLIGALAGVDGVGL